MLFLLDRFAFKKSLEAAVPYNLTVFQAGR